MHSKIALKNVRKSFRDYSIYFLTLTLAVCIFYSFNSIGSQKALLELEGSEIDIVSELMNIIEYMSVFVSVILGSLILYANNFLIKKRKKELGIYTVLGMGKRSISRVLVTETFIVGAISLIAGLVIGIGVSQGLSVFAAKLFEADMKEYVFVFSGVAIGKTILYFGIIFLLVALFNTVTVSKYRAIDLIAAGKKNQNMRFKSPIVYALSFILSVISLGTAYSFILDVGLNLDDSRFLLSIILGIAGTVLFFFSVSSLVLYILKRSPNTYFKGLNIFTARQLGSKINTNFLSMSLICLMLFMTMAVLSAGLSLKDSMEAGIEETTPFDAGARTFSPNQEGVSIEESLRKVGFKFENNEKYESFYIYDTKITIGDMFDEKEVFANQNDFSKWSENGVDMVKLSDYNKVRKLEGKSEESLNPDEVLVLGNFKLIMPFISEFLIDKGAVSIDGRQYSVKNKSVISDNIYNTAMKEVLPTIVANDEIADGMRIKEEHINIDYDENYRQESEEQLQSIFNSYLDGEIDDYDLFIFGFTREAIRESSKGMTATVLFVGIYMGIVFLIASMAVLALQQLSEASDSIERYKSLKRIGASEDMVNKTVFTQTAVYFTLPLALAAIHSYIGIKVVNQVVSAFNKPDIGTSSLITACIFIIIYGGYFIATYSGYKNIVKSNM